MDQKGNWKIDARFNRAELRRRILRVAGYAERIEVHNMDAIDFLEAKVNCPSRAPECFVYLDPPYFVKGSQLYLSYYSTKDHCRLSRYLQKVARFTWVLTYDDAEEIRSLYGKLSIIPFSLRYSASASRTGSEVFISRRRLTGAAASLNLIAS